MRYSFRDSCNGCDSQDGTGAGAPNQETQAESEKGSQPPLDSQQSVEQGQKSPNILQKAKNFAKASAGYAASGFENVSDQVKSHRMQICNSCEFLSDSEENPECSKCGCFVNIKTSWGSESCPVGKWGALNSKPSKGCGSCGKKKT